MWEPQQISGMLLDALLVLESAAKALVDCTDDREFLHRKEILKDSIRRVEGIRNAEIAAARAFVRDVQAKR